MLKTGVYPFETVENDLLDVKMYTLANGLKLFLSVNPLEPRIFTSIAVRSGSKQDPPETTGLAHYMEHMLFKGTSRIGATDWEQEKVLLQRISDLYEQHRTTTDPETRKAIYAEIDRVSNEAAKLVAPNEYDKLISAIGGKHTNAYTWVDQTVYLNDIPSNELERWMELESERFRMLALRLFHTELETVYEEFNINQDRDFRKVNQAIREVLFPSHPYGTQTTIGAAKDLRNPSHVNIQRYFQQYYVPNNMALILAGDFDPDQAVALAEKYFGHYQRKDIPEFTFPEQPELTAPVHRDIRGQEAPYVTLAWRFPGGHSEAPFFLTLLQHLFYNQQAGLLDLNLNQQHRLLESESWYWFYQDFSVFGLYGRPREGQSMEAVRDLLLEEVEKVKSGAFEDWLLEACITDFRLGDTKASESNQARANAITQSYILGMPWDRFTHRIDWMANLTRQNLMEFARKYLRDNYVSVFKHTGPDPNVIKVEKPPITSVTLNRDAVSDYAVQFLAQSAPRLEPVFPDFAETIGHVTLDNEVPLDYVHNPINDLFRLNYIFEMGKNHDRALALALTYLPYLGTEKYTPAELQQAFFRHGLHFDVHINDERCYITLQGLNDKLEAGLQLFEHLLAAAKPNREAWENVRQDVVTKRENAKKDRNLVLRKGLNHYARYGAHSPFRWMLSGAELDALQPKALTDRIRSLNSYQHRVYYYGQKTRQEVVSLLNRYHQTTRPLLAIPDPEPFIQLETTHDQVYFLDFPIVQTDVLMMSKGTPHFNLEEHLLSELYNNYFGFGLSSIVFQEIRESRALAYSTFAYHSSPERKEKAHYLQAYVGTQPDKLTEAIPAMHQIIEHMPLVPGQIAHAREAILKRIESERIRPDRLYWNARSNQDLGFDRDLREDIYRQTEAAGPEALQAFHERYIKGRHYTYLVMGSKAAVDLEYLRELGPVTELTMEDVFGY